MASGRGRRCRVCGCTDDRACVVQGVPCCWVSEDLCSACATVQELLASEDAGWPWLVCVMSAHLGDDLGVELEVPVPVIWREGL